MTFKRVQDDPHRAEKIVGFDVLDRDLASGNLPNYAHIVPNQCNEMHGRDDSPVHSRGLPQIECRRLDPARRQDRRGTGGQDHAFARVERADQQRHRHYLR